MSRLDRIAMVIGYMVMLWVTAAGVLLAFCWAFYRVFIREPQPGQQERS